MTISAALRKDEEPSPQKTGVFCKGSDQQSLSLLFVRSFQSHEGQFQCRLEAKIFGSRRALSGILYEHRARTEIMLFHKLKGLGENGAERETRAAEAEGWKACLIRNVP